MSTMTRAADSSVDVQIDTRIWKAPCPQRADVLLALCRITLDSYPSAFASEGRTAASGLNRTVPLGAPHPTPVKCVFVRIPWPEQVSKIRSQCRGRGFESLHLHPLSGSQRFPGGCVLLASDRYPRHMAMFGPSPERGERAKQVRRPVDGVTLSNSIDREPPRTSRTVDSSPPNGHGRRLLDHRGGRSRCSYRRE
jgi:hypothetical protein